MNSMPLSLEQLSQVFKIEQDWLFEKLLGKLNSNTSLILAADQGFGIQEYLSELGFQLEVKNREFHTCYVDLKPAQSPTAFLELYVAALSFRFPDVTSSLSINWKSLDVLKLPGIIAKRKKIRIAVFLVNSHLFHRFRDRNHFLRMVKLNLKSQRNSVFCICGNNNPNFRNLVKYPGPLSGMGLYYELHHNPLNHRTSFIKKLFHDHGKNIGISTSVQLSNMVDNHPFYLKLLVWHALIKTHHNCTTGIIGKALNDLIHHFDDHFYNIVEKLTTKQLGFLRALMEGNQKLYSQATREAYQLGSTNNVARIKLSLQKKEIIKSGKMLCGFTDPLFREWLRRHYFSNP